MKKLLILALTSAFVAAANADATINWGVTTSTLTNASWNDDNAPGVVGSVFKIDADVGDGVALLPSGTAPAPQVKTVVTIDATFTAISDDSSLEQLGTDAKTALTVAKDSNDTPHYYYWNPLSSDENKWTLLGTTATPNTEQAVTVVIELDYTLVNSPKAKFKIGNTTPVEVDLSSETTLTGLAFAGTGDLTSVAATVTPAYATYNNKRYESTGAAIAARDGGNGVITVHSPTGSYPEGIIQNSTTHELYFPRTTTAGQNGSTDHPYEIADVDDLIALKDAVADVPAARSKSYEQTANINMAGAGAFAGIGDYNANPTAGTPFTGTYDGGNLTISNVDFTQRNYGGIFNQVNGGTIKNLTVTNITCSGFDASKNDGEWGCAIVGNAGNGAKLINLTSAGDFGTADTPCSHNVAGVAVRLSEGDTLVQNCTNNATLHGTYTKLGGICALTQNKVETGTVKFEGCVNKGEITATENANKKNPGADGIAGIVAYAAGKTELKDCVNTGSFSSTYSSAAIGELVGKGGVETNGTLTDLGGNKGDATKKLVYIQSNVTGFKYATVDNGVATTVTLPLAANTTYLLEGNVAASATPVFTLAAASDTIAFDAALGYTFAGTIGSSVAGYTTKAATVSSVTTYSLENTQVPVATKTATTLVSVPQTCTASTLINTSNRDSGDLLQVLNKSTNKYYQWSYDGAGGWTPNNVVTGSDIVEETPAASTITLTRGEAVWVTRKDTSKAILLNAAYSDEPVTVTVVKGYNLIAPLPKEGSTTVEIDEVVADDATGKDKVFIPAEGKAPYNLDFKDGNWGYDKYTIKNGQLEKVRITGVTIPAGTGFFYINNGDAEKSVTLGSED